MLKRDCPGSTKDFLNKSVAIWHSKAGQIYAGCGVEDMDQPIFADLEYQGKKRRTRRELFLERMDGLIPWRPLEERIRPVYPKPGRGRRTYPLAVMLLVHCVQFFYNLSDPGH